MEVLFVMDSSSTRQEMDPGQIHPRWVHYLVWIVVFFISATGVDSPYPIWGAIYQCRDTVGEIVLTDRPLQLRNCRVLIEGTAPAPTSPASATTLQGSVPPITSERRPTPPYASDIPSIEPPDRASDSLPLSNPAGASTPPSPPCSTGINPLNPLSTAPCVRPDQSGATPPTATPVPFE